MISDGGSDILLAILERPEVMVGSFAYLAEELFFRGETPLSG